MIYCGSEMGKLLCLLALSIVVVTSKPTTHLTDTNCGYETCQPSDPNKINVHLIPHSHDDVGWLKTVDQYYYGANTKYQNAGVQYMISTTVDALKRDENRRYIQVETAYFKKWWADASDSYREDFIDLVNKGQIEMIGGAISMNDEACTHYQSTIDQFTWGLKFLKETLGTCGIPKIGWQIDPFGHSREMASLFVQLGFNGFFFSRLDDTDKNIRRASKRMDFVWKGSASLENSEIFGTIHPGWRLYIPPDDLHWDLAWNEGDTDDPIIDNTESPDYNVPKFLSSVTKTINEYKNWFPTNNIIFPMGGDFQYQSAEIQYTNMDRLIKMFQNNSDINMIYSTPSCYLKAVNDANPTLKLKTDDFFPYGSTAHEYWAGYFTSRPNSKRFERMGNNILQATKQLTAVAKILNDIDYTTDIDDLKEEMGIMQHHDAITGTEKQHVASDYVRRLTKGVRNTEVHLDEILGSLLALDQKSLLDANFHTCLLANVSVCHTSEGNNIIVVYNPLSQQVNHFIRIPVPDGEYKLIASNWSETDYAITTPISDFKYLNVSDGTPMPKEMVIEIRKIPPLGAKVFILEISPKQETEYKEQYTEKILKYGTDTTGFEIDSETNLLKSVTINSKTVNITQEFLYYQSALDGIHSGAYIFRPEESTVAISLSDNVTIETTQTDLVDEVLQTYNDYIKQIIRVYKRTGHEFIEFDWLVGPLPDETIAGMGREIITRFTVEDFDNKNIFYTDSNGRELIKRELNKRPDYEYDSTIEPIASNYYPVPTRILIRDETKNLEVALLNDRPQGGSSLNKGELELMVHRRLFHDDAKGVGENLNETEFGEGVVVRGTHYLTFGDIQTKEGQSAAALERFLVLRKLLTPVVFIGNTDLNIDDIKAKYNLKITPISDDLPSGANLLTFEHWSDNQYILRIENIFEKDEDPNYGDITVDLNNIFTNITFTAIRETTLGANQWLDEYSQIKKFTWKTDVSKTKGWSVDTTKDDGSKIVVSPMQIRTFIVDV